MGKTDYTKAEEAFSDSLRNKQIKDLLAATEKDDSKGTSASPTTRLSTNKKQLLLWFRAEVKRYSKEVRKKIFHELQIDPKFVKKGLADPLKLTDDEWKQLEMIRGKWMAYRDKTEKKEERSDEEFIEAERKEQGRKRFNVKKTWIPLH